MNDIEILSVGSSFYIRISIGDSMYFDTPPVAKGNATAIYTNLISRLNVDGWTIK